MADHEAAITKLIAQDAVFVTQTHFRAFLHLSKEEIDDMSMDEYIRYSIMLKEVLHTIHAPYLNKDKINVSTSNG